MKNPFYSLLTPLLTVGVTLFGFFLLKPEETTALYWINMVYLLCLELLFFVWLKWGRFESRIEDRQTPYYRIFLGVGTVWYIIASVLWMIYFFICGTRTGQTLLCIHFDLPQVLATWPELSIRLYLFVIVALTVAWIVIASIVGRHDVAYSLQQTSLEQNTADVRNLVAELKSLAEAHQTEQTRRQWSALIREAESVPPRQLATKEAGFRARANQLIANN